jgi:hypothetical protein
VGADEVGRTASSGWPPEETLHGGKAAFRAEHARNPAWVCSHGADQGLSNTLTEPSFFSRKSA